MWQIGHIVQLIEMLVGSNVRALHHSQHKERVSIYGGQDSKNELVLVLESEGLDLAEVGGEVLGIEFEGFYYVAAFEVGSLGDLKVCDFGHKEVPEVEEDFFFGVWG